MSLRIIDLSHRTRPKIKKKPYSTLSCTPPSPNPNLTSYGFLNKKLPYRNLICREPFSQLSRNKVFFSEKIQISSGSKSLEGVWLMVLAQPRSSRGLASCSAHHLLQVVSFLDFYFLYLLSNLLLSTGKKHLAVSCRFLH